MCHINDLLLAEGIVIWVKVIGGRNTMKTIKDVARLANVAVSTASYALNGTGKVSEETRKKVLKAAEELGYRPSGVARDLKRNRLIINIAMNV
jgi:DNA-binding LacI/PurR family transcriptional regulator